MRPRNEMDMKSKPNQLPEKYQNLKKSLPISIEHYVIQSFGIDRDVLSSDVEIREKVHEVAEELELNIWQEFSYDFKKGVSIMIVISESHLSAHTWPEYSYIHLDLISCSGEDEMSNEISSTRIEEVMEELFSPEETAVIEFDY